MADSKHYVNVPVNADGSINVKIAKGTGSMDVNIKEVDSRAFFYVEPIPVKVK